MRQTASSGHAKSTALPGNTSWSDVEMPQLASVAEGDADTSFGELLRYYRRLAELTQEELAERSGLSVRSISDLERGGAHVPRRATLNFIARALDLDDASRGALFGVVNRRRGPRRRRPNRAP